MLTNTHFKLVLTTLAAAALAGCGSPRYVQPPTPAPVENPATVEGVDAAPAVAATQQLDVEALKLLTQVEDLQREMQELRNQLEQQGFEMENLRRRQRELYDDLDARLIESEQRVTTSGSRSVTAGAAAGTAAAASGSASQPVGSVPQPPSSAVNNGGAVIVESSPAGVATSAQPGQTDSVEVVPAAADPQGEQAYYDQAFEMLKGSRYGDAVDAFRAQLAAYPNGELADDAQYWIGEAQYVTRAFEPALNAFQSLIAQYPNSTRVPDSLLKSGYIQYEVGAYADARRTFNDIVARYPGSRVAISAQTRLAKMDRENLY